VTTTRSPLTARRWASKSLPAPLASPPPWTQTSTGLGARGQADRGAVTLRYRQSSVLLAGSPVMAASWGSGCRGCGHP
jgi:hypothetical protein